MWGWEEQYSSFPTHPHSMEITQIKHEDTNRHGNQYHFKNCIRDVGVGGGIYIPPSTHPYTLWKKQIEINYKNEEKKRKTI